MAKDRPKTGLGERIDQARHHAGINKTTLAERVGATRSAASQWISETTSPDGENLRKIALETGVNYEWLATARGEMVAARSGYRPASQLLGELDLPVYAAAEGGPGQMVVSTEIIAVVPRPWYMGEVRDGFAVLVVGESMTPAFDPGDMAIVNPRLPVKRDDDVILISGEPQGEFIASIKRLVRSTPTEWKLRQFNPARDFTLSRREWPKALRVVGKYYG